MRGARDLPLSIQWHEGMLLAPQHFQQLALRQEELLHYHVAAAAPFHWGIRHMTVDRVVLLSGIFRVMDLEAVMPDGLIVHHMADSPTVLEFDINPMLAQMGDHPVTIFLVVPLRKSTAGAAPGDLARFESVDGPLVVDENGSDGELRIPRLRPRISLHAAVGTSQKPPPKYVSFPLARVVYRNETFSLTEYVPPSLAVGASSPLGRMCADVAKRAREKALFLAERAGAPSSSSNQAMLQETQNAIRSLVTALPPLEALVATGAAHPFQLYLALTGLVGQMAAFAPGLVPPVLTPYDHDNPGGCFQEAADFAIRMIDRIKESYTAIRFDFENERFGVMLQQEWLQKRLIIGVRGPSGMSEKEVSTWIEESLIASRGSIESLWERRVLGAPRQRIEQASELDLVPARGVVLFAVTVDMAYISPDDVLEIWNSDTRGASYRPSEIVLYVRATA